MRCLEASVRPNQINLQIPTKIKSKTWIAVKYNSGVDSHTITTNTITNICWIYKHANVKNLNNVQNTKLKIHLLIVCKNTNIKNFNNVQNTNSKIHISTVSKHTNINNGSNTLVTTINRQNWQETSTGPLSTIRQGKLI